MGVKKRAAKIAIRDAQREHAEAYLRGDYPGWRLNLAEWAWVRRLRKAQADRSPEEPEAS